MGKSSKSPVGIDSMFEEFPVIVPTPKPTPEPPAPKIETPEEKAHREAIDAYMEKCAKPPECVLKGVYPDSAGRMAVHVTPAGKKTVRNEGALMGWLYKSGAFLKIIQDKHVLFNPPAIAYDKEAVMIRKEQIKAFCVYVTDKKCWYTVDADTFFEKQIPVMNRGSSGQQIALPLIYWKKMEL